jgi:hypothetical protein
MEHQTLGISYMFRLIESLPSSDSSSSLSSLNAHLYLSSSIPKLASVYILEYWFILIICNAIVCKKVCSPLWLNIIVKMLNRLKLNVYKSFSYVLSGCSSCE